MATGKELNCWHCGASLSGILQPMGRREECPQCASSLHVCHMCTFFDLASGGNCREPMADAVRDREKANFCDYFRPKAGLSAHDDPEAELARAKLNALFGGETAPESTAKEDSAETIVADDEDTVEARKKLAELFNSTKKL